jgi:hypothetical protein
METTTCNAGHDHRNDREAEGCDRKHRERALERAHRELQGLRLIQELSCAFYVNRRAKAVA